MSLKNDHTCVAEYCEKCKQDHCKCTPCPATQGINPQHEAQLNLFKEKEMARPTKSESWIFYKVNGRFCQRCRLYYEGSQVHDCSICHGMLIRRTYYERTQIEALTAILIWGILTVGIVWAIMLAGKIILGIKYFPPLIYDPDSLDSELNNPDDKSRISKRFVSKLFWSKLFTLPGIIILVLIGIAFVFFLVSLVLWFINEVT
jgi:hypothetical protein